MSRFHQAVIEAGLEDYFIVPKWAAGAMSPARGLLALARFLVRAHFDIVHLDAFDACYLVCAFRLLGGLKKAVVVFTLRSDRYHRFNFVDRFFLSHVNRLVTNSDYSRREIFERTGIAALVHYSPIDLRMLSDRVKALDSKSTPPKTRRTISYVGALEPRKNLSFFIDVAEALLSDSDHYEFHVYGLAKSDEGLRYLDRAKSKLTVKGAAAVHFKGYVPVAEAIHATDVLLCPFINEPMGRVVPEFLYCGRKVVVSSSGGLTEAGLGYAATYDGDSLESCLSAIRNLDFADLGGSFDRDLEPMKRELLTRYSNENSAAMDDAIYKSAAVAVAG
jgi:glycosyltransferase involved in cell wall biosynthesis